MCLFKVDKKKKKISGYFWKVFRFVERDDVHAVDMPFRSVYRRFYFVRGEWMKAEQILSAALSYPSGFHGFVTKQGAKDWQRAHGGDVILRCRYRKVIVTGQEIAGGAAIVAREIYLPKNARKK